jgi:hypothetical protein
VARANDGRGAEELGGHEQARVGELIDDDRVGVVDQDG